MTLAVGAIEDSYRVAVSAHWDDTYRFALSWVNDLDDAQDLAQSAFERLWSARASFDWEQPVLPWLLTTTRRLAVDRFRATKRRLGLRSHDSSSHDLDEATVARWLDVRAAMTRLTAVERASLILHAVEGFSYDEVGSILAVSAGAARAAASRGRAKLESA